MSRQIRTNLLSLAALCLLLIIATGTSKKSTNQSSNSGGPRQTESTSTDEISAEDLFSEYQKDRAAAEEKYKGKVLRVSGVIDKVSTGPSGNSYVLLKTGSSILRVQCIFDGTPQSASRLQKDERATFKGKVVGKIGNVVLSGCELQ